MKIAVADIQGFFVEEKFYPKEVSIKINKQILHVVLKSPKDFTSLSKVDQERVRYIEDNFLGIKYSSGYMPCNQLPSIIKNTLMNVQTVYIKGEEGAKYLRSIINNKVVDLDYLSNNWLDVPNFQKEIPACLYHTENQKWTCSLTNCRKLYTWLQGFLP